MSLLNNLSCVLLYSVNVIWPAQIQQLLAYEKLLIYNIVPWCYDIL